ncbi:hypothetical protein DSUL_90083 [Desulfovibrionales bacterium]
MVSRIRGGFCGNLKSYGGREVHSNESSLDWLHSLRPHCRRAIPGHCWGRESVYRYVFEIQTRRDQTDYGPLMAIKAHSWHLPTVLAGSEKRARVPS